MLILHQCPNDGSRHCSGLGNRVNGLQTAFWMVRTNAFIDLPLSPQLIRRVNTVSHPYSSSRRQHSHCCRRTSTQARADAAPACFDALRGIRKTCVRAPRVRDCTDVTPSPSASAPAPFRL